MLHKVTFKSLVLVLTVPYSQGIYLEMQKHLNYQVVEILDRLKMPLKTISFLIFLNMALI